MNISIAAPPYHLNIVICPQIDRIFVNAIDKDAFFVCNASRRIAKLYTTARRYQRYVVTAAANSIPDTTELGVLAPLEGFAWTPKGRFFISTKFATYLICGKTGNHLFTWDSFFLPDQDDKRLKQSYITNMLFIRNYFIAVHESRKADEAPKQYLVYWFYDSDMEDPDTEYLSASDLFKLQLVRQLERVHFGVTNLVPYPEFDHALMTTAEGNLFRWQLPTLEEIEDVIHKFEDDALPEAKDFDVALAPIASTHINFISSCCFVNTYPEGDTSSAPSALALVSSDDAGNLRVAVGRGSHLMRFRSAIQHLVPLQPDRVVVGSESGVLRVATISKLTESGPVRTSSSGFANLSASRLSESAELVCGSLWDGRLIILLCQNSNILSIVGCIELPGSTIETMCFLNGSAQNNPSEDGCASNYLLGSGTGAGGHFQLWTVDFTNKDALMNCESAILNTQLPLSSVRLNAEPTAVSVCPDTEQLEGELLAYIGFASGCVSKIVLPTPTLQDGLNIANVARAKVVSTCQEQSYAPIVTPGPEDAMESIIYIHDQPIASMAANTNSLFIGGMDGVVVILQKGRPNKRFNLCDPFAGGCWALAVASFSLNSENQSKGSVSMMAACGSDLLTFRIADVKSNTPEKYTAVSLEQGVGYALKDGVAIDTEDAHLPIWSSEVSRVKSQEGEREESSETNQVNDKLRQEIEAELMALREKLDDLVDANERCPELEKLERDAFCVDKEVVGSLREQADQRCAEIRMQVDKENLARRLIRNRLVKEFWKPMRKPGSIITSLLTSETVGNFPERELSKREETRNSMLNQFRQVELRECQWHESESSDLPESLRNRDWVQNFDRFSKNVEDNYIVNLFQETIVSNKSQDPKAVSETKDGSVSAKAEKKTEDQIKHEEILNGIRSRIYAPFELTTNARRKTQIVLLQQLGANMQHEFNLIFAEAQKKKKETMGQINEKISRIRSILKELGLENEEVVQPSLLPNEIPGSVLDVKEEEVPIPRFISPEEEAKRAKEAAEEAEISKKSTNDAGTRALTQMMGGTLKTKKDLTALEKTVDREAWIDEVPREEWSELQVQLYEEYEIKEKALLEEQDNYRKLLHQESKSLKGEVHELMTGFETRLEHLGKQRNAADTNCFLQEIYAVRLCLSLLQTVEDQGIKEFILGEVERAKKKVKEAQEKYDEFVVKVRQHEKVQEEHLRKDKEMSHNFRAHFQTLEPEAVVFLLKLFRQRNVKEVGNRKKAAVGVGDKLPKLHPHKEALSEVEVVEDYSAKNIDSLHVSPVPEMIETLSWPADCSLDTVDEGIWFLCSFRHFLLDNSEKVSEQGKGRASQR